MNLIFQQICIYFKGIFFYKFGDLMKIILKVGISTKLVNYTNNNHIHLY